MFHKAPSAGVDGGAEGWLSALFHQQGQVPVVAAQQSQSWVRGPKPRALVHDGSVTSRGGQTPPQGHWLCCGAGSNPPAESLQSLGCFLPFISPSCPLRPGPNLPQEWQPPHTSPDLTVVNPLTGPSGKTLGCLHSSSLPNSKVCESETRLILFSSLGGHFRPTNLLGDISWPRPENVRRV